MNREFNRFRDLPPFPPVIRVNLVQDPIWIDEVEGIADRFFELHEGRIDLNRSHPYCYIKEND